MNDFTPALPFAWRFPLPTYPITLLAVLSLSLLVLGGCDPFNTRFDDLEDALYYQARQITPPPPPGDDLLIMNWNTKYAGGRIDFWFDCHGDRVLMESHEVYANLEGLAEKIRLVDADILLVQEIDIDSKRGAYIDQVQWILDHTDYNYAVYASQWKADFIPSDGLGRMNMGNAIFSKHPLHDARRIALPQSDSDDALTRYFYLNRNILTATLAIPGFRPIELLNVHVDAYSHDGTKKVHIDLFKEELDRLDAAGLRFVGAGDLNTLPPGSEEQHVFADAVCEDEAFMADDYRPEADWLTPFYEDYQPAIPLEDYQADNERHFSHSVSEDVFWNRKLDYIFTNGAFVEGSGLTHQDESSGGINTMALSDHAPLSVRLILEPQ